MHLLDIAYPTSLGKHGKTFPQLVVLDYNTDNDEVRTTLSMDGLVYGFACRQQQKESIISLRRVCCAFIHLYCRDHYSDL